MKNRVAAAPAVFAMSALPSACAMVSCARAGLARLGSFCAVHRRQSLEIRDLESYSDRGLRDIGLNRYDVDAITSGTYRLD